MRVGAANLFGGGCSIAEGAVWPDRRKRGGVAGLPCSVGCNRSLVELAATAVGVGGCAIAGVGAEVVGVCAAAGKGDKPSIAAMATPATVGESGRELAAEIAHPLDVGHDFGGRCAGFGGLTGGARDRSSASGRRR